MILQWGIIRNLKSPDAVNLKCPTCSDYVMAHRNWATLNIPVCGKKNCNRDGINMKKMVEARGWIFNSFTGRLIDFVCDDGHQSSITLADLRRGQDCKTCRDGEPTCDCKKLGKGFSSGKAYICSHYNHKALHPKSAAEWDNENPINKGYSVDKLAPTSQQEFGFKCKTCKMSYDQSLSSRSRGCRCPYCSENKVCLNNCLQTTHSDLALLWDPDNTIKVTEITYGSTKEVSWICMKHEKVFKWDCSPNEMTSKANGKVGCPKCLGICYDQLTGGHEHFVKIANEVHKGKYTYPERYVACHKKLNIMCVKHGLFPQKPANHKLGQGCPNCAKELLESKGMTELKAVLDSMGLRYICEEFFSGLCDKRPLRVDIYLIDFNLIIEYDGEQHFRLVSKMWGGEKALQNSKRRDKIKDQYCLSHGINLCRIPFKFKPSVEHILFVLGECKKGLFYSSYPDYYSEMCKIFDMTRVNVRLMEPLKLLR
jgi:very-short-patch-repair endonuclease